MIKGKIFNIQRFSVHDGPGIRTTVFMKGCPLKCLWCHNPESKASEPVLGYYSRHCNFCGRCADICPQKCHSVSRSTHTLDRENCILCGKCVNVCPKSALEIIGRNMTPDEIITEASKDKKFYDNSGGGLTLSGGEPLLQPEFALDILKIAKENNLHTCVETSGFTTFENLEKIMPYTDLFLYDWKETNNELHKKFTGAPNELIYDNLLRLDKAGAKTILRCPVIPNHNNKQEHYLGIAALANQLTNIVEINVMPYHTMGSSKCDSIGCHYPLPGLPPLSEKEKNNCVGVIKSHTSITVIA